MPETFDSNLIRRWVHAHEEDVDGKRVFRPDSYPLPRSRGRTAYEFRADGTVVVSEPGASDRSTRSEARWRALPGGRVEIVTAAGARVLEIDSIGADRLTLKN